MKIAAVILISFWAFLPNVFGQPCTSSLLFDNQSIGVQLPSSNQYYSGNNGGYTWECWFKLNQPFNGQSRPLISAIDATIFEDMWLGFGWQGGFFNEPVTKLVFKVDGPNSTVPSGPNCSYAPTSGFQLNVWYHAAGVMDYTSQTAKLYVNGLLVDTKPVTTPPITRTIPAELSYGYSGAPLSLNGNMDEVRIWDRALTGTEIAANYNHCLAGTEQNLLLYYRCNENQGIAVSDATSNNMIGVFTDAIGWSLTAPTLSGGFCTTGCNVEICGNGTDDDLDGLIDEDCGCPVMTASNDTTVCSGQSVQLSASAGFDSYSWSPATGLSNPSIQNPVLVAQTTTTYTVTGEHFGPNLILNPDFSQGSFAVATDYPSSPSSQPCYSHIGSMFFTDQSTAWFSDHSPGSDNMYLSIDGCYNPVALWKQQIQIEPNMDYEFSYWATCAGVYQPIFEIHMIGNITGDQIISTQNGLPPVNNVWAWDEYTAPVWNSGPNTSVIVEIRNLEPNGYGVDFGMDDFLFQKVCRATESVVLTVNNVGPPLDLGPDLGSCIPQSVTLNAGTGFTSYLWSDGSANQTLIVSQPGTYWVSVTDACGNTKSDTMNTYLFPSVNFDLGPDLEICKGENVVITAPAFGFTNHLWSGIGLSCFNCVQTIAEPQLTTNYSVSAITSNGCQVVDTIQVVVKDDAPTDVIFTVTEADCYTRGSLLINQVVGGNAQTEYAFGNQDFSMETSYPDLEVGNYPLVVRNGHDGCPYTEIVQITGEEYVVYIPNAFTPDGNEHNNSWFVQGTCVEEITCHIYDRWGQEVVQLSNMDDFWDGTYKGLPVPDGIYSYSIVLKYSSNAIEVKTGFVAVLR